MRRPLLPPARHTPLPVLTVLVLFVLLGAGCPTPPPEYRPVVPRDGAVRIPRSAVADGRVHFYRFETGSRQVRFLVRTDGTGTLRIHLDACFSCYRYRQGFVIEGEDLVCRACRYRYPVADPIWEYQGACAPIPLPATLEGEELVIASKVLERARRYF